MPLSITSLPVGAKIYIDDEDTGKVTPAEFKIKRPSGKPSKKKLVTNGLVGYWCFNEGEGDIAHDRSGYGNDGTLKGPTWVAGKVENALSFDGKDDWVKIPADPSLNEIVGEVTVAAWIYISTLGKDQKIFGTQDGNAGGFKMCVYRNNKVELEIRDSRNKWDNIRDFAGGTTLEDHKWYHVVSVYSDSKNWLATYVNSELDRERSADRVLSETTDISTIGREPSSANFYWHGIIDELYVFNRALSEDEIGYIYRRTK